MNQSNVLVKKINYQENPQAEALEEEKNRIYQTR